MPVMIKLTSIDRKPFYLNASVICMVYQKNEWTTIEAAGDVEYHVRETPEEIDRLISEWMRKDLN